MSDRETGITNRMTDDGITDGITKRMTDGITNRITDIMTDGTR